MITIDTSALISLATIESVLKEFEIHTTTKVIQELKQTAEYKDLHGKSSQKLLNLKRDIEIHEIDEFPTSSRVDEGEGSCIELANELDSKFLVTDDLRAVPELKKLTDSEIKVAISPIILKALVKKDILKREEAKNKLNKIAKDRSWLETPIYKRAKQLF